MEMNYVLQQHAPAPSVEDLHRAFLLLNHVHGELEDEDGDWATDFIVADRVPPEKPFSTIASSSSSSSTCFSSSFSSASSSGFGRSSASSADILLNHHDFPSEADPSFICQVCSCYLPLQMLGPDIICSCLCCIPCLRNHVELCISQQETQEFVQRSIYDVDEDEYIDGHILIRDKVDSLCFPCPCCFCNDAISSSVIQFLAPQTHKLLEEKANQTFFRSENYILCPGCSVMVEKVPGDIPEGVAPSGVPEFDRTMPFTERDKNGKPLSRDALLHKCHNYYKCSICKSEFCGLCMKIPYHLGYTCKEFEEFEKCKKCIYCETSIPRSNSSEVGSITNKELFKILNAEGFDTSWCVEKKELLSVWKLSSSVCNAIDCRQRVLNACTRVLDCGHRCGGLKGEKSCLPCMEDGCRENTYLRKGYDLPSADDWCTICMVEPLRSAPSIQLKCGHVVHFECAKRKIQQGYPGPEITFGYLNCPQCSEYMEHECLTGNLHKPLKLLKMVKERALKRAQVDKLNPFMGLGELADYATKKYNFYLCSKCQTPYYGGNHECGANLGLGDHEARNQFNPLDLVCGGCSAAMIDGMTCIKGHGRKYVEFKCRYCCSRATYFCFGRTHFCNQCHQTRPDVNPDYVPPICAGPNSCPLKIGHAPNGEEHCLGCSMCRILSQ